MDDIKRSLSYSQGGGYLPHTDRTIQPSNADPDRTKNNIVLVNESLSEAYEKIFGEAQAEYNAKQKRSDRKIDDYFCKLFGVSANDKSAKAILQNDNKQKSFYEYVIGIGGSYDTGLTTWENELGEMVKANPKAAQLAADCLREYITGNEAAGVPSYEERNPNFHLVKAIIHMDEKTPHLHTDLVPFCDGFKKGMSRQQGIAKALEAMGYGTGKTAIADWQEAERKVLREICERHGFTIRDEEKSRGFTVLSRQYGEFHENELLLEKQEQEMADNQQQLAQAKADREAEDRAAEQARQRRTEDERAAEAAKAEVAQAQSELDALNAKKNEAEHNLIMLQEIPPPPKPPYKQKPQPLATSKDEYIKLSIPDNMGFIEKQKTKKTCGEEYDKLAAARQEEIEKWEQYEREEKQYRDTYGIIEKAQKVAAEQAQTAQKQAQTAAKQSNEKAKIQAAQNKIECEKNALDAEKRNFTSLVKSEARQLVSQLELYKQLMSVKDTWASRYEQIFGKPYQPQKAAPSQEQKQDKGGLTR